MILITVAFVTICCLACKESTTTVSPTTTGTTTGTNYGTLMQKAFADYGNKTVTTSIDGNYLVVTTTTVPNHKSPYFATSNAQYEAYNGTGTFAKAPNTIAVGNITFKIPIIPTKATTAQATPMGPIGVALNGVPFFNQYAAGGSPLTNEILGFDQYGGHPQQQGQYHYHLEPFYITATKGKSILLGFLTDGFPVYGPLENGKTVVTKDLDAYHGHLHITTEYPNGIYHYHITSDDPYINGSGYYGTPGTVSK